MPDKLVDFNGLLERILSHELSFDALCVALETTYALYRGDIALVVELMRGMRFSEIGNEQLARIILRKYVNLLADDEEEFLNGAAHDQGTSQMFDAAKDVR